MKNNRKVRKQSKRKRLLILIMIGLIIIGVTALISNKYIKNNQVIIEPEVSSNYKPDELVKTEEAQVVQQETEVKPVEKPRITTEWPIIYSSEQANSLTVVVNKKHKLPSDYVPSLISVAGGSMRPEAANELEKLLSAANSEGVPMSIISSYRSYNTQVSTYNKWVQQSGQAAADTFSARPGHSEHQTGLAVDLGNGTCNLEICFGDTPAGNWLASNAQNYGFIIRYPEGKQAETGYQYEPWHIRFIGINEAKAVANSGQTLDQYYSVEAGDY